MCVCVVTWGTVVLMSCLPYNKGQVKYKVLYSRLSQRVNIWIKTKGKWTFAYNCFFLPRSASGFRFLERQFSATIGGTSSPWTPQNKWSWKPTEPTSPSRLPALLSSALPESPWEKVASPPPHQPQCSDMPVFVHIKGNSASVCVAHTRSQMSCLQKIQLHGEKRWFQFMCLWFDFSLRSDSGSRRYLFRNAIFSSCVSENLHWGILTILLTIWQKSQRNFKVFFVVNDSRTLKQWLTYLRYKGR